MGKARVSIPRNIRDRILAEFNHKCARCTADRPQLHHIDENPSNNEPLNLIPLCPNCHLSDQHNPTQPLEQKKLRLLRQYKDPTVLSPQFHVLFQRLRFLDSALMAETSEGLAEQAADLINFVELLEMGAYYAKQIKALVGKPFPLEIYSLDLDDGRIRPTPGYDRRERERDQRYLEQLRSAYDPVHGLVIELLRFQNWTETKRAT